MSDLLTLTALSILAAGFFVGIVVGLTGMGGGALMTPALIFLGFFITRIAVPAYLMLGYWFLLQILGGLPTLGDEQGGVAFWAHAGGFIAGAVLVSVFKDPELVARHRALARTMEHGLVYRERF